MKNRDYIEGLMAASLYEPLSSAEQAELDAWLASHPEDAVELASMRELTDFISDAAPVFAGDLRPVLREELMRGAGHRFEWSMAPRVILQLAGALGITAILVIPILQGMEYNILKPTDEPRAELTPAVSGDALSDQAAELIRAGEVTTAHKLLSDSLEISPKDPNAGHWQMTVAKLEFENLGRYAQAYDAYLNLRAKYGAVFASSSENAYRFDVLEQTKSDNFGPLYDIARARDKGMPAFHELEHVVARYSGRGNPVAELALNAMSDIAGGLNSPGGVFRVAAYEQVRRRCNDPVALAQLNDSLGQLYLASTGDVERARQLFQEVVDCGNTPLAADAQMSLASLETER